MDLLKMHFSISWLVVFVTLLQLCSATSDSNNLSAPLCTSSACAIRAGRILNALDTERTPCTEFVDFACGGMFRSDQNLGLDSSKSNRIREDRIIKDKLNRTFYEDRKWAPEMPEAKAKTFYENCKRSWFKIPHGRGLLNSMALALGVPELYRKEHSYSRHIPTPPTTYGGALRVLREQFGVLFMPNLLRTKVNETCLYMVHNIFNFMEETTIIGNENDLFAIDFFQSTQEMLDMRVFRNKFLKLKSKVTHLCKNSENLKYSDITLGELIKKSSEFGWPEFLNLEQNSSVVEVGPCIPDLALYLTSIWKTHPLMMKKFLIASAIQKLWTRKDNNKGITECIKMVKHYFSEITTASVLDKNKLPDLSGVTRMAKKVRQVLKERINNSKWLDSHTRNIYIEKLESLRLHIGYPDVVENETKLHKFHSSLNLTGELMEDLMRMARWREDMSNSRCDLDMWDQKMHPLTANAVNMRTLQSVSIPMGQMMATGYDERIPASLNYAGIGLTLGHEIMHTFDQRGRKSDRWLNYVKPTKRTKYHFKKGENCLEDYYNSIKRKGVPVDGKITIRENIADVYGLDLAYDAWREEVNTYGEDPRLPGVSYTPEQLFFIHFAQTKCDDLNVRQLEKSKSNVHAPGYARVIGSVAQSAKFKDAFQCSDVDNPAPCELW